MYQGKLTYAVGKGAVKAKFWSNFVTETRGTASHCAGGLTPGERSRHRRRLRHQRSTGMVLGLVGYGYNGWGLGQAGLFWDGIGLANNRLCSDNSCFLGLLLPAQLQLQEVLLRLQLRPEQPDRGDRPADRTLLCANGALGLQSNSSHIAQFRYAVTKWDNLVAEYTHTRSEASVRTAVAAGQHHDFGLDRPGHHRILLVVTMVPRSTVNS